MKVAGANIFNAIILIAAGVYGYFFVTAADGSRSLTALIPAAFGILFLGLHKGIVMGNKVVAHLVVVLTLVLLVMCVMRFVKVPDWNEKKYIFLACIISNAIALVFFIMSFIAAKKARSANGNQ